MTVNMSSISSKAGFMHKILNWIKSAVIHLKHSATVLLVLGLIVFLVLLWWLGPKWEFDGRYPLETMTVRWLITLGVAFFSALIAALVTKRRLSKVEREHAKEKRDEEDPAQPVLDAQEARFNQILTELHKSTMVRNYLYLLPWYIVIGAEGAGKTSLINRSNQNHTQTTYSNTQKRDQVEPPYKIDCWIGNDALLIDPDGELISGKIKEGYEAYRDLPNRMWEHLVDWLDRTRSRRPLNGIVLAVDLPTLLDSKPSDRKTYALQLRGRVRELIEKLGTRLPVYIVLTKFDLLDGFDAFFRNLPRSEREQLFGFTFSLDSLKDADHWLDELSSYYDAFLKNLNDAVFDAVADAPNQQTRNDLFVFSRQMVGVRDILVNFLSEILESDRYATPALVRGLYFTSVYQQGIPRNAFIQTAAASYNLPPRIEAAKAIQRSLTFFSKSLFHDVIYPEAGLAGDNTRTLRNKRRIFALASVVAGLTAVLVIGGWQHYYRQNIHASEVVLAESKAFMKTRISDRIDITGRNLLEPLNHIRKAISVYGQYRDKLPLVADLGLYQGRIIGPKVEESYLNLLSTRYLPALGVGVIDKINAAEPGSNDRLAALRIYRMIEDKANRRKKIVKNWMAKEWHQHFEGEGETQRQLMIHLDYALDFAEADLPQFKSLVKAVQRDLRQTPLSQRVYQGIKQDAYAELHNPVDLRQRVGPSFDLIYKNENENLNEKARPGGFIIDAIFTAPGFKGYFVERNENIIDLAMIDKWVLGERAGINYSEEDKRQLADRIRSHYINDYLDTWKRTLGRLEINDFEGIEYAVKVLETLTGPTAPLQRLIETVREHAEIYPALDIEDPQARIEAEKKLLSDPNRREAKRIQRNFQRLDSLLDKGDKEAPYYEELIKALGATYDYMATVQNAPDRGKAALSLARDRFKLDGADPIYALERIAAGLPEPLSAQMDKVAKESWKVLLIKALQQLEKKWDQEIYQFFEERLAGRYPFNPTARIDVALEDFEQMFGPNGKLTGFYNKYLKVFLHDNLNALYSEEDEDYLVRTDVLQQLEAAWAIQNGFFDNRGALNVNFNIEPLALSANQRRSVIDIDGQRVSYSHGPTHTRQLIWPNTLRQGAESKVTLISTRGRSKMLRYQGPWSWFRLLDRAHINGADDNMLDIIFQLGDGKMRYRVHAEKSNNPLLRQLFKGFRLPRTLLREKSPAGAMRQTAQSANGASST